MPGGLMLADSPAWLDFLKVTQGKARILGLETELISIEEAKERHPLINEKRFLGALYDPMEGHVDPAGVTHAYAKSARIGGAEIERFTRVLELHPLRDGGWEVVNEKRSHNAEHGVTCAEIGRVSRRERE